jgi:hypothetical protein
MDSFKENNLSIAMYTSYLLVDNKQQVTAIINDTTKNTTQKLLFLNRLVTKEATLESPLFLSLYQQILLKNYQIRYNTLRQGITVFSQINQLHTSVVNTASVNHIQNQLDVYTSLLNTIDSSGNGRNGGDGDGGDSSSDKTNDNTLKTMNIVLNKAEELYNDINDIFKSNTLSSVLYKDIVSLPSPISPLSLSPTTMTTTATTTSTTTTTTTTIPSTSILPPMEQMEFDEAISNLDTILNASIGGDIRNRAAGGVESNISTVFDPPTTVEYYNEPPLSMPSPPPASFSPISPLSPSLPSPPPPLLSPTTTTFSEGDVSISSFTTTTTAAAAATTAQDEKEEEEDENYNISMSSNTVTNLVKQVLLELIEKNQNSLGNVLHLTTLVDLQKLKQYLNQETNVSSSFRVTFNFADCKYLLMKKLERLASKFFNVRCLPDSLERLVNAFVTDDSIIYLENEQIQSTIRTIIKNISRGENARVQMTEFEYNTIVNKDVKQLVNLYNERERLFVDFDPSPSTTTSRLARNSQVRFDVEGDTASSRAVSGRTRAPLFSPYSKSGEKRRKRGDSRYYFESTEESSPTRNIVRSRSPITRQLRTPSPPISPSSIRRRQRQSLTPHPETYIPFGTESEEEEEEEEEEEREEEMRQVMLERENLEREEMTKRRRAAQSNEEFIRSKAQEFARTGVNMQLERLIKVTNDMRRLYDFCICKNPLNTVPKGSDYASLLKRLDQYNLDAIQMDVNFAELLFPLTLYHSSDMSPAHTIELEFKIINYIFLASNYFQRCAENFYNIKQDFNMYGPFRQLDSMVMFVIKFNFLCDLRNFAATLEDVSSNKVPNMKIHNVLMMRDKMIRLYYNRLQFDTFTRSGIAIADTTEKRDANKKYIDRLITLMNANFNVV